MFRNNIIILSLFAIIGLLIYWNALDNPFQHDDSEYVVYNTNIRDVRNIPRFFVDPYLITGDRRDAGHYRPLVVTSYAVNYFFSGLNPAGYHLTNLGFHIGTAFLVFLIVKAMLERASEVRSSETEGRRLKAEVGNERQEERGQKQETRSKKEEAREEIPPDPPLLKGGNIIADPPFEKGGWGDLIPAIASGLIFLVHPFNSEAINYITARSSVMSGFFYLLAFWGWIKYRQSAVSSQQLADKTAEGSHPTSAFSLQPSAYYFFSLLAFVAGMLSKEIVVTLPVVLWLYDLYFTQDKTGRTPHSMLRNLINWRNYIAYLPFILAVLIPYIIIRMRSFGGVIPTLRRDLWTQIFTGLPVLQKHWEMFFWPGGLNLAHHIEIYRTPSGPVVISILLFIIFIVTASYFAWRGGSFRRIISFFMFWFFIVLLPTTLFPLNAIFQESRGYLAIVGFVIPAGVILAWLYQRVDSGRIVVSAIILLLGVYSAATVQRNIVWGDDVRFWADALKKSPQSLLAYAGLSRAYRVHGDLLPSIETAKKGVSLYPDNLYLRINLARSYWQMNNPDKAIQEFKKALILDMSREFLWRDISVLFLEKNDYKSAEEFLREALKINSKYPPFYYYLGKALNGQGRPAEAVEEYKKAVTLYPSYLQARHELAEILDSMGRQGEAIEQSKEIVRLGPITTDTSFHTFLQDSREVENIIEKARLRIKP